MNEPILITGCARSGTSMVAGIINLAGAFGGAMSGPNRNNQKGMFENHTIRQNIVKPYFRMLGVDAMGQYPLPDINNLLIPADWKIKVQDTMKEHGYKGGPWFYKGAKMCLHWPVWNYAFPNAKWIIVRRRTGDIIQSCQKTSFMRSFGHHPNQVAVNANNEAEGWRWWVEQHLDRFREMQDAGLNIKVVWPERMVDGDYSQMNEMLDWLGLEWTEKIPEFIEPKLWKVRQKDK